MKQALEITRINRNLISKIVDAHTLAQLNTVPKGFSNTLIWNIAHIVVTQQLLVYKLSGLPLMIDEAMVESYKKGSKTERPVTADEVTEIKNLLFSTLDQTEKDIEAGIFKSYTEYPTSTGYTLRSIEDAFRFNNFHEGIHLGYILALKKAL